MSILDEPLSDEEIAAEASRQISRRVEVDKVHISLIRAGDTVFHEGWVKTVGAKDIKYETFMGYTLFGDSYILGRKPVRRLNMKTVKRLEPEAA